MVCLIALVVLIWVRISVTEGSDCEMSVWLSWTRCTASCNGGQQIRSRHVVKLPSANGSACGNQLESRTCESQPCPVDCLVAQWGKWSCDCRTKKAVRERVLLQSPRNNGQNCPTLMEIANCPEPCPIDCQLSRWSSWSNCSEICGVGEANRSRTVLKYPTLGGTSCGRLMELKNCIGADCNNVTFCSDNHDGIYGIPGMGCSQTYYSCVDGKLYNRRCPEDLVFVPSARRCEFQANVKSCMTSSGPLSSIRYRSSMLLLLIQLFLLLKCYYHF